MIKKIFFILFDEIRLWAESLISFIPGRIGIYLRKLYYFRLRKFNSLDITIKQNVEFFSFKNISIDDKVSIDRYCRIYSAKNSFIKIGKNVAMNKNILINARGGGEIKIGDNCLLASNVVIRSNNHKFDSVDIPIKDQGVSSGKIVISDDVWIGSNAVILPNVTIGKGVIIGAGSVVTKDIKDYEVVGGIPAKTIKNRIS